MNHSEGLDCFARRQENGYVVRICGSEYLLTADEMEEFVGCVFRVGNNLVQAEYGSGYVELRNSIATGISAMSLLVELGLVKPAEGIRRRI